MKYADTGQDIALNDIAWVTVQDDVWEISVIEIDNKCIKIKKMSWTGSIHIVIPKECKCDIYSSIESLKNKQLKINKSLTGGHQPNKPVPASIMPPPYPKQPIKKRGAPEPLRIPPPPPKIIKESTGRCSKCGEPIIYNNFLD